MECGHAAKNQYELHLVYDDQSIYQTATATRESIPPEYTVQDKMSDNSLWNLSERQHIVLGPGGILDSANESFNDWFMIISSSQVKIYVYKTLGLIEFFIRPDLFH
jgi:hypothetical protein